nr:endolytic transglycosylase MltG [Bacteroidota bacterium]
MVKKKKGKKSFVLKIVVSLILVSIIGGGIWAYDKYKMIYLPNVFLGKNIKEHLYIPSGSTMQDVVHILYENGYIINKSSFEWLAEQKNYKNHVYPGRYVIKSGMSNNKLIDLLRSGEQEPLKLTFNSIRTKEQLAIRIASQIEADSLSIMKLLLDKNFLANKYHMNPENILSLFIPNTYEFYWNTSAEKFLDRMANEYKAFWTEERKAKARQIGLSQSEVTILASIVQAEQSRHNDEKPIIAGLYINRLKKGMRLESDPTLVYAHGDFSINRVLNIH